MEDRNEGDRFDEVMLPGFRFHPTDEELVGFYLTRKIQQKPLSIELIKQIDIYKYDPWDLPKLATNGEKEWYFYCPRDRKYRNSMRPNRVTGAGFWKATGTDRPIYSSESTKCIGLKKSLVFYRGKAAKGTKTDWMMHEFRLPSISNSTNLNEALAICRIFKKANSNTKRAISHSWVSPVSDATQSDIIDSTNNSPINTNSSLLPFAIVSVPSFPLCRPGDGDNNSKPSHKFSCFETATPASRCTVNDATSLLLDMPTSILGDFERRSSDMNSFDGFSDVMTVDMQRNLGHGEAAVAVKGVNVGGFDDEWRNIVRSPMEFPLSFPSMWDSSSPCPSDLSTSYSTNKCYTRAH